MAAIQLLIFLLFCSTPELLVHSITDGSDVAVLQSLKNNWENSPPNWNSDDPCGTQWDGVGCTGSRVTSLGLSSMNLKGRLSGDIGGLSELRSLDLSFNPDLTGSLTASIGDLQKLNLLILAGCGFTGSVPKEIGNLAQLTFLALNSNNFSGDIPPSLGKLTELYWLDLSDNQIRGSLPVSNGSQPGLDLLLKAKHFHFNKNQLSGPISEQLFNSSMVLIHILLDGNQITGKIPDSITQVSNLEVLRLDRNKLSGPVPSKINSLTKLSELHLANNALNGAVPDLTGLTSLNYVDLSNNAFDLSEPPKWFSTIESLTTLVMENGNLRGPLPTKLFSFPELQQVKLKGNLLNGTLDLGNSISQQLQLVDLQNNQISSVNLGPGYTNPLILVGNPVCNGSLSSTEFCQLHQALKTPPYSTSLAKNCKPCPTNQRFSPASCDCVFPYEGKFIFRAPSFRDVTNATLFGKLESDLWSKLGLEPGSVSLDSPEFDKDDYLQVELALFPSSRKYFSRPEISRFGFNLTNQTFKPPHEFGPYLFKAVPYEFQGTGGTKIGIGVIVGIAVGSFILLLALAGVAIYAIRQKKRAEEAIELNKPFASWAPSGKDSGGAPILKGARWFSYEELKKCTNNFSDTNEIGSGGYGKVYRGILTGQEIAIKRAQQGSMQGAQEFKTEIELLSRVHHKNLVGLVGFCFEQGEQMLVYEFMPNGTLRESLSARSGIYLDWKRRLRIALGSARGLAYLHELANPPIIHRDIKTTNILLDANLTAKVADFGLSKLVQDAEKGHVSTQVKGTLGYLDPEYYMTQQLTEKSDVYSFGVVMLELITARQPIEKGKYIVREVRMAMNKTDAHHYGLSEIMDPSIKNIGHLIGFANFLELAMRCVEETAAERPTMGDCVKEIEAILQNDGVATDSATSSATDFGASKGVPRHPYNESLPRKDITDSESFEYSGGISATIEPK
ncbi:probable leucine-rich repeat receptor-like protein kinase At5g49770 [Papaver somniferum]|uniref:probable leucine-rich repeat receptor-like protein kinase At5g49770 n=1 Tax=Papaver somniferum TaxID=3469 RepID=UPI000E706105|nr:probable leucine-rich repeat receptor-like protein kinase At5g49770 [Papaver somniferum]